MLGITPLNEPGLQIARSRALDAYGAVEQSLCSLLAHLGGMDGAVAATIFFKITASRSRSAILDKLYKRKYKTEYREFFNSLIALAGTLDQRRNEIVHWHLSMSIYDDDQGNQAARLELIPPNFWDIGATTPAIGDAELEAFATKCDVVSRAFSVLRMRLEGIPEIASLDIFDRALPYPLPDNHPLSRKPPAQETPPPASAG